VAGITDPGYSWQRQNFDLDKLARLFRNFVSYENTGYPCFATSRSLCAWLLRALHASTGGQSAAGRRLSRRQHGGRGLGSSYPHQRNIQYGNRDIFASKSHRGALVRSLANLADENTANGAGALLINVGGSSNTATGAFALFNNVGLAAPNTAIGAVALFDNTTGIQDTATGSSAFHNNSAGSNNTADGF
jgi:hypothetical protein